MNWNCTSMKMKCKLVRRMQPITVWVHVVSSCVVITAITMSLHKILSLCFYKIANGVNLASAMTVRCMARVCLIHINTIWMPRVFHHLTIWRVCENSTGFIVHEYRRYCIAQIQVMNYYVVTYTWFISFNYLVSHWMWILQSLRHSVVMETIASNVSK